MIQRIQSLFLLLSAALSVGTLFLPFAFLSHGTEGIFADSQFNASDHIGLYVIFGLAAALALAAIFLFKNRKLQATLCTLTILVLLAGLGFAAFLLWQSGQMDQVLWGVAWGLPLAATILALVARRYIKRDDRLVRSMDRLR